MKTCTGTDGSAIGVVVNFTKHQKIDRPSPSRLKPLCTSFDEPSTSPRRALDEPSLPDQGSGNRDQGIGIKGSAPVVKVNGNESKPEPDDDDTPKVSTVLARLNLTRSDLLDLFNDWRKAQGNGPLSKLPRSKYNGRTFATMVVDLLDLGYTIDELRQAIEGNRTRAWNVQKNAHSWDLVFRDQKHVDTYLDTMRQRDERSAPDDLPF